MTATLRGGCMTQREENYTGVEDIYSSSPFTAVPEKNETQYTRSTGAHTHTLALTHTYTHKHNATADTNKHPDQLVQMTASSL